MHFSTATLIALLAAAPSTLAASLLQPRQGYTVMGSPGELLLVSCNLLPLPHISLFRVTDS